MDGLKVIFLANSPVSFKPYLLCLPASGWNFLWDSVLISRENKCGWVAKRRGELKGGRRNK